MKNPSSSNLFNVQFDLHYNGRSSFHSHFTKISNINLPDFNPDLLDTAIVKNNLGLKVMLHGTIRNDDF